MVVVSDTSPLRYLIAAGRADLIAKLFGTVLVPRAVEQEILDPHAPSSVQQWMVRRPDWLQIRAIESQPDLQLAKQLDRGEAEAIQLAVELQAEVRIIDERRGRQVASVRGLKVVGTLGMLRESYRRGFISDPLAVAVQLGLAGFRASRALRRRFEEQIRELERVRQRKEQT